MKLLALIPLACLAGIGGFFLYVSWSVSETSVRSIVTGRIQALTGYAVEVRGQTVVTVFPAPRFEIRNVVLKPAHEAAAAAGAEEKAKDAVKDDAAIAMIDGLRGSIDLLPLLTGSVQVTDFTLVRPRVTLSEDRHGRVNWADTRQGEVGANVGKKDDGSADLQDVQIGSFRIEDGAITYVDQRGGVREEVTAIKGIVDWPRLSAPLEASGSLVWNGEIAQFGIEADSPMQYLRHGSTRANVRLQSGIVNASFDGNAHYIGDLQFEGKVAVSAPSTRALLRWTGAEPNLKAGLDALELAGTLNVVPGSVVLSEIVMSLDENEAEGSVKISLNDKITDLQGTLAFDVLDLSKYRTVVAEGDGEPVVPGEFLATPVDLSELESLAVDLRLSAASVIFGSLELGRSAGTITVRDGTLDIGVGEASLYGGTAQGTITSTPTKKGTRIKATLKFDKTNVEPFLAVLSGGGPISGTADASINLAADGTTIGGLVSSLSGDARLKIADGAFAGVDVDALVDLLTEGSVEGWPATPVATPFSDLTASFVVTEGRATTDDFHLVGPKIDVTGEGEIRLISASVAGHGTAVLSDAAEKAEAESAGRVSAPFVIEGPIARPRIYPDPVWLLNRSAVTRDEVEKTREDLKQKTPEEIVDEILSRGIGLSPGIGLKELRRELPQQ